ncbi:cyclic peptide export ABC transporter [Altericista sp. CCNU0014]|uniref:cyclic peptide export ABC transporter n=1 Tax=Altericista sp. CCNU0014 TaxID=3082949 RepID=UPI00384B04A6
MRSISVGSSSPSHLRHLEELGANRLLATLTEDIQNIAMTVFNVPTLFINAALILGCLFYLGWLSFGILLATVAFLTVAISIVQLLINKAFSLFVMAREENDALMKHFRGITDGIKELKLHQQRREDFLEFELQATADALRKYRVRTQKILAFTNTLGEFLFFILLGLLVFGIPHLMPTSAPVLSGYVLTIAYMMRLIGNILATLPNMTLAAVSLRKIDTLGLSLASRAEEGLQSPQPVVSFQQIALIQATHHYKSEGENNTFTLGPIDLEFSPGEIVFIVGGNGSGKSTLAKLITGLYLPDSGKICLDGIPITHQNRETYRQLFSTVFSDFYLFERLLGVSLDNLDARAKAYLEQLQLSHKVQVENGSLSTTELSQGQRKRLALLTAYLDDRPVYLFDEWAADQDPFFREVFYQQILPELKKRGKVVLVISHDDRYFHLCDRLIKLDYGQIV